MFKGKLENTMIYKEVESLISFAPLWRTIVERGISQYQLINQYGVSTGTLDSLRKNKSVTLNTVQDLCRILNCSITDIVEILPDE